MKQADIAVYDPDGQLQLVVEIKNRPGASAEWATRLRHNLLVHSFIPRAPYFLLALPDFFYLWTDALSASNLAKPDYEIEATEILAPYLNQLPWTLNDLSKYGFEMIVTSWLERIVYTDLQIDEVGPNLQWLFDSGLYEAILHGSVAIEATV